MQFSILASGSTGNSSIIRSRHTRILVDVGLTAKKMKETLDALEQPAEQIDAILITHEHSDHIKGLGAFARKYRVPVYANKKTWDKLDQMSAIGNLEAQQRRTFTTGEQLIFADIMVQTFGISHDAAEPVGFTFQADSSRKLSLVTDLGYVSERIKQTMKDSDIIVIESNHDVELLRCGHYPWNIKRRILSDIGHLSNIDAAMALTEVIGTRTRKVYLAHLSLQHNMIDLARMTVSQILQEKGVAVQDGELAIVDTYHDKPTAWEVV
jgi:phosphoribosyl 1,2-cyclic phosphodiesterase